MQRDRTFVKNTLSEFHPRDHMDNSLQNPFDKQRECWAFFPSTLHPVYVISKGDQIISENLDEFCFRHFRTFNDHCLCNFTFVFNFFPFPL